MTASSSTRDAAVLPAPPALVQGEALLLDFDGTLVEIAEGPNAIHVPAALPVLLGRLAEALEGRVAIVSGRAVEAIDRHLGTPPVAVLGSHGGEFRGADETVAQTIVDSLPEAALAELRALSEAHGGLLVEAKPTAAAIHFRSAPQAEAAVRDVVEKIAESHGLRAKAGKMVAEIAVDGADKGSAVRHLMREASFKYARPVFAGDDVTDEDAFAALGQFGGAGVLVGPPRETRAQFRLDSVAAVHAWLRTALEQGNA